MIKKIFSLPPALILFFLMHSASWASTSPVFQNSHDASLAEEVIMLDISLVSKMALADNLDIRIFDLDEKSHTEEVQIAESIYDSVLFVEGKSEKDRKPSNSVFGAVLTEERSLETRWEKTWITGTETKLTLLERRSKTDTSFVDLNPSFETVGELYIKQPVFKNFLGITDRLNIEKVKVDTERFNFQILKRTEDELLEVRRAFWKTLEAWRLLLNQKLALRQAWRFFLVTRDKEQLGLLEKPDVYAALANVKRQTESVLISENLAEDRSNDLKTLLNLPLHLKVKFSPFLEAEEDLRHLGFYMDEAFHHRYDRQQALLEVRKRDLVVKTKKSEIYPQTDIEASLAYNGLDRAYRESVEQAASARRSTYYVGFNVAWDIENREAHANLAQSNWDKAKALLQLEKTEKLIAKEADESFRDMLLSQKRLEISKEVETLERKKLDEEQKRFDLGRSGSDLMIDYLNDYLDARNSSIETQTDYKIAWDELQHASGRLLKAYAAVIE